MYVPNHFREDRPDVLLDAMRRIGFATLVTAGEGGIEANHLPLLLDAQARVLRGHFARANPVWRNLGAEALAIFLGPHAYVSPGWYPSKAETGKAVPTWNYITVHARGPITLFQDADWLRAHVAALSDMHEAGRAQPWALTDAPASYIDGLLRAIVGFEIAITQLEGKWKLSQNRSQADRDGVRAGLLADGDDSRAELSRLMGGA
jgi:transcriptional regulator